MILKANNNVCTTNFLRHIETEVENIGFNGTNFLRFEDNNNILYNNHFTCSLMKIEEINNSIDDGCLPEGCKICQCGQKLPVYITMKCNLRCNYCPIDPEMLSKDICLVDGVATEDLTSIIILCKNYSGISISGGEPLLKVERTLDLIRALKNVYGNNFHIHLYTNATMLTHKTLDKLIEVGLDEIRPSTLDEGKLKMLAESQLDVTLETVAISYRVNEIKDTILKLSDIGITKVILTEAEINNFNIKNIITASSRLESGHVAEKKESIQVAEEIRLWAAELRLPVQITICTKQRAYAAALKREKRISQITMFNMSESRTQI